MSCLITKPAKWHVCPAKTQISLGSRVFTVRMKKAWVLSYPLRAQQRLWSDSVDAQADLSLLGAQSFCWFCHKVAQIIKRLEKAISENLKLWWNKFKSLCRVGPVYNFSSLSGHYFPVKYCWECGLKEIVSATLCNASDEQIWRVFDDNWRIIIAPTLKKWGLYWICLVLPSFCDYVIP